MTQKSLIRLSIIGVGVLMIVGAFGWLNWASNTRAADFHSDNTGTDDIVPVFMARSKDGSIEYGYGIDIQTRSAGAMVTYDYLTKEGIEQYVAFNNTALERLMETTGKDETLSALITFAQPLTQEEFIAFVVQYHLSFKSYIIWIESNDGTTTTIQGTPSDTELIPAEQFN